MKINFGKYCGKNIINIINDKNYKEWLLKQDFFKEKYTDIYNAIINYKPIKKINYNDLPDDIIEYINNFNAIEVKYRGGKYLPIYYPIKSFDVDQGGFIFIIFTTFSKFLYIFSIIYFLIIFNHEYINTIEKKTNKINEFL